MVSIKSYFNNTKIYNNTVTKLHSNSKLFPLKSSGWFGVKYPSNKYFAFKEQP